MAANDKDLKVIGKPYRKVDARAKCIGQTRFADWLSAPGTPYHFAGRTSVAHGTFRILIWYDTE